MALNVDEDESYIITTTPIVRRCSTDEIDTEVNPKMNPKRKAQKVEEQEKRNILTITTEEPLVIEPDPPLS